MTGFAFHALNAQISQDLVKTKIQSSPNKSPEKLLITRVCKEKLI